MKGDAKELGFVDHDGKTHASSLHGIVPRKCKRGVVRLSIINEAVYHGSVCRVIRDEMGQDFCHRHGDCRTCVVMYMVGIFDQIRREGEWR